MATSNARLIEALRRAFGYEEKTPTMFAMYLRERYPDVWVEISRKPVAYAYTEAQIESARADHEARGIPLDQPCTEDCPVAWESRT